MAIDLAIAILAIPFISVAVGMIFANIRGAEYRPEYANIP
jgi:hypothetical protein